MKRRMRRSGVRYVPSGKTRRIARGEGYGVMRRVAEAMDGLGFQRCKRGRGTDAQVLGNRVFVQCAVTLGVRRLAVARYLGRSASWVTSILKARVSEVVEEKVALVLPRVDRVGAVVAGELSEREKRWREFREQLAVGANEEEGISDLIFEISKEGRAA